MPDFPLSQRVQTIKASPTLVVTARAAELQAQGKDIISLGAGEPDFDTPQFIKDAAIAAINAGLTKYTPVGGTPELKRAVIDKFTRENGLDYTADQILVSVGAKQSFYNLVQALINPGDEVIIPAPYWVSYLDIVLLAEGVPVVVTAGHDQAFKITPDQLGAAITSRTRLVVLNSPSNPTGAVYSAAELRALGEVLLSHPHVIVASDDIYEHILWTPEPFCNILNACPDLYGQTIVLNGVSKAYAMTGWRIGYAGGPKPLISAMAKVQSQSTSNPASISQAAARAALEGDQSCVKEMCKIFEQRHDFVVQALNAMPGVECVPSAGTFYSFPAMHGAIEALGNVTDDVALAEYLLDEAGVAVVPGSAFGMPGYVRLSYATHMDDLKKAMTRIRGALEQ
jgi:aspartate aminotransferase